MQNSDQQVENFNKSNSCIRNMQCTVQYAVIKKANGCSIDTTCARSRKVDQGMAKFRDICQNQCKKIRKISRNYNMQDLLM
jgi:hypothetical protein